MGQDNVKIAVLSGKGGTGKTLVSVNLAAAEGNAAYIDCDVEEPNGHLFFKPQNTQEEIVSVKIPRVDGDLCTGCRKCVQFCRFNALAYAKKVIVFDDICHSCGGCALVCPTNAISEVDKRIGVIQDGKSQGVRVITGRMDTGIMSGVPIIKSLLKRVRDVNGMVFVDCPPGSGCAVMESIADADYCILVAEPTVFGAHNLQMVYGLVKLFQKPYGVVLNKCTGGANPSEDFCKANNIPILAEIPYDKHLGVVNSRGEIAVREHTQEQLFYALLERVKEAVS